MQGPSIIIDSDDDQVLTIDKSDFSKPMFQIPSGQRIPPIGSASPTLGLDSIINKRKVNSDVLSVRSGSSGYASSDASGTTDESYGRPVMQQPSPPRMRPAPPPQNIAYSDGSSESGDDTSDDASDAGGYGVGDRMQSERNRMENEYNEKREILYQMDRLESRGYRLPKQFSMQSDLEEMRAEYHRILREKEVDASIKFQRKMMMAFVTGIEYLNTRFDPFDIRLSGWSEHVSDELDSYDDIFVELHDKYKSTGKKMAPELRLLLSLSGSAFMFHLTSSMFKQSQLPGVEEVLRSNPELMRQFQQAAAQNMMGGMAMNSLNGQGQAASPPPPSAGSRMGPNATASTAAARGPGGGLFSMVGNLFGMGNGPMSAPAPSFQMPQGRATVPNVARKIPTNDIEDVIHEINAEISSRPPSNSNRMETMSVSDEEILSIIEDTTSMASASKPRKPRGAQAANKRTLNL